MSARELAAAEVAGLRAALVVLRGRTPDGRELRRRAASNLAALAAEHFEHDEYAAGRRCDAAAEVVRSRLPRGYRFGPRAA